MSYFLSLSCGGTRTHTLSCFGTPGQAGLSTVTWRRLIGPGGERGQICCLVAPTSNTFPSCCFDNRQPLDDWSRRRQTRALAGWEPIAAFDRTFNPSYRWPVVRPRPPAPAGASKSRRHKELK